MGFYRTLFTKRFFGLFFFIVCASILVPSGVRGEEAGDESTALLRRIDFGNSYIMGAINKVRSGLSLAEKEKQYKKYVELS